MSATPTSADEKAAARRAQTVGVVGLGLIGSALSQRLMAAGYRVLGHDVDAARNAALAQAGGEVTDSLADLARRADPILLAVFDTAQTEDVVENGILPAVGEGSGRIVLAMSTLDPDRIEALSARVAARGLRLLDTPISGSSSNVAEGSGVTLIGGDADALEEVAPVLDAIFAARFHMGKPGNGGRAKLAINLIAGLNRLVIAEGLVLGERMGLEPKHFLDVARRAASYSRAMDQKGAKMVSGDFEPLGRARQHLKDVQLMLEQGRRLGQQLPLATVHADVLEACLRAGEGDRDNSIIINEIRRRTWRRRRARAKSTRSEVCLRRDRFAASHCYNWQSFIAGSSAGDMCGMRAPEGPLAACPRMTAGRRRAVRRSQPDGARLRGLVALPGM